MIVRCTNCVSAFAVDDEKVANKKFAFTCPKCGTENIFDNRNVGKDLAEEDLFFGEDTMPEEKEIRDRKPAAAEEDLFADELFSETPKTKKGINLEIEESPEKDEIAFDEGELFAEEEPVEKAGPGEEIVFDEEELPAEEKSASKAGPEEEILFDEGELEAGEEPAAKALPEEDIFLDDFTIGESPEPGKERPSGEEEIFFDEELEAVEKTAKNAPDEELLFEEEFIIDESETPAEAKKKSAAADELEEFGLELEELPEEHVSDRETKISSQEDIDALFADLPPETPSEKTGPVKKETSPEDDITVNLDELDIELEEEEAAPQDEFVYFDESGKAGTAEPKKEEPLFDEEITIDMNALDIDIEDAGDFHKPPAGAAKKAKPVPAGGEEEELVLNIDEFGGEFEEETAGPEVQGKKAREEELPEEDITLDLDTLDIDLDESEAAAPVQKVKKGKAEIPAAGEDLSSEEELKLNLDDLDMDIEEFEKKELVFDDEIPEELSEKPKKKGAAAEEEEDESITIDLDTLDIEVSEPQDVMAGEMTEDEEIKLTLDEIDPELKLQVIGETAPMGEKPLIETVEELPEIDLEEYEAVITREKAAPGRVPEEPDFDKDELLEMEIPVPSGRRRDLDILEYDEEAEPDYLPEKGSTSFSIDYSLRYSRSGAVLRLLGLYVLSLIPHFILILVYTILSAILGFINQIVILSTGRCVEDFSLITENTLRYFLYIKTNITGIVEDRPVYAGRENLSHQLQLNVTYPMKYSRNFAILRLSIIGIWLITLPHFIEIGRAHV